MKKYKVLLIDDDHDILLIVSLGLKYFFTCFDVITAQSGPEGITIAETQQPDIILLDVLMDPIDGFETCIRLKANPKTTHIPVVFLSAKDSSTDEKRAIQVGGIKLIQKHTNPEVIGNHILSLLGEPDIDIDDEEDEDGDEK